jgi:hypothetical protein
MDTYKELDNDFHSFNRAEKIAPDRCSREYEAVVERLGEACNAQACGYSELLLSCLSSCFHLSLRCSSVRIIPARTNCTEYFTSAVAWHVELTLSEVKVIFITYNVSAHKVLIA